MSRISSFRSSTDCSYSDASVVGVVKLSSVIPNLLSCSLRVAYYFVICSSVVA